MSESICRDCKLSREITPGHGYCCDECWQHRLDLVTQMREGGDLKQLQAGLRSKQRKAAKDYNDRIWGRS